MAEKMVEAISEETLDEVAGGLKLDKSTMKKALIGAGVAILGATAVAGGGTLVAGKFGKGPAKGLFNKGQEKGAATITASTSDGGSAHSAGTVGNSAVLLNNDMDDADWRESPQFN